MPTAKGAHLKYIVVALCLLLLCSVKAQNLDSLFYTVISKSNKNDSSKVTSLEKLTIAFFDAGMYEKTIKAATQGILLSNGNHREKSKGFFNYYIGKAYYETSDFSQSLHYYQLALVVQEHSGDSLGMARTYGNIGNVYLAISDYPRALEMQLRCLKISEKIKEDNTIRNTLSNLGIIYYNTGDYQKSLEYHTKSLEMEEKAKNKAGIGQSLGNIGIAYQWLNDTVRAIQYYERSISIAKEVKDLITVSTGLMNMGDIYQGKKEFEKAHALFTESKNICAKAEDKVGVLLSELKLASLYALTGKLKESEQISLECIKLSREMGTPDYEMTAYQNLNDVYDKMHKPIQAYQAYKKYVQLKDSINSDASQKAFMKHEMSFEFEKKEEIAKAEQERKDAIAQADAKRQQLIIYSVSAGLLLVMVLVVIVYRNLQTNKKKNKIIEEQKALVEHKNKEITDSINYAKRLQEAILPPLNLVKEHLPQSFILYKPKDIVAGDFYWFSEDKDRVYIAAADCTGHGVPGALMSMVGIEKLNEVVDDFKDVSDILQNVNRHVKKTLRQSGGEDATRDGMDVALCSINKKLTQLSYAGANRPLWIIRKEQNEIQEIKATKNAIGGFTEDSQVFASHQVELNKGDAVYIFSDGYADQFSANDKKLMTKKFKETVLSIQNKTMEEQKQHLDVFIEDWKGGTEQTDDILVIGIRVPV